MTSHMLMLSLAIPATLGAAKIPACPGGRYLLAPGDAALIFGEQTPTTDAMTVGATRLSTPTCGATHAKPKGTKKGTVLRATWKKCGSFKKVVATATITDSCATMTGTIKAKQVPARVFTAHLSTGCGDHLIDKGLGEQCEGDGDCDVAGTICASCACEAPTTTTRTTSSSTTTTSLGGCHRSTNEHGVCGNCVVDPGEDCDDGNRVDGDACTNQCHIAQCGDGVVETGVEECDDGNHDETDGCTSLCKLARCGDGFVEKGFEDCDDGETNGTAGDPCHADCTFPKIACAPSGRTVLVATLVPKKDGSTFSAPKGLTLSLGYPSGLSIPGSGSLALEDPNDPAAHIVLLDPNLYNGLIVLDDSDTVLKTAVAPTDTFSLLSAFPFERVSFDCTSGELFNAGQFLCSVIDEADRLGGTIGESRRPDCSAALAAAP